MFYLFNMEFKNKNFESRDNINKKLQNFRNISDKNDINTNNELDNDYYSYKPSKQDKKILKNNDYKNDINERLSRFNDSSISGRRLPFNNNISDYNISYSTKKDDFNERISNYSLLGKNMNNPFLTQNMQESFHSNFKEEINEKFNELSPLSSNMSFPIHRTENEKKQVMEKIKKGEQSEVSYNTYSNDDNYQFIDNFQGLNLEQIRPVDSKQKFNFQ